MPDLVLTGLPASDFMRSFKASLTVNGMETISIKEHRDLRGPEYNQNIVSGENAPCYVDIQNFVLADRKNINKAKEYLSERSFSPEIYSNVLESLEREDLSFKGQKVLLVGEDTAGLLPHVLSTGARWSTLCLQEDGDLREYEKALYLYGLSRFELLRLDNSFKQSLRDCLFSSFDIICLDETTIPWLKEILSQISAPTDILLFGEKKENDVRVISQYISKYMPEEKGHISVLCLEKGIAHNTIK